VRLSGCNIDDALDVRASATVGEDFIPGGRQGCDAYVDASYIGCLVVHTADQTYHLPRDIDSGISEKHCAAIG
jgi:hypothetical protein